PAGLGVRAWHRRGRTAADAIAVAFGCSASCSLSGGRGSKSSTRLHGYFRYLVRLQRGQHLSAKPAQLLHEHGVGDGPPVEAQKQRVGAHSFGLGDQLVPHLLWSAAWQRLVALQVSERHIAVTGALAGQNSAVFWAHVVVRSGAQIAPLLLQLRLGN